MARATVKGKVKGRVGGGDRAGGVEATAVSPTTTARLRDGARATVKVKVRVRGADRHAIEY